MSKTVDERVVQMKFDNRQFEQGVSKTMSTLDKFKQKLNLTGASKGLNDVEKSAQNLNRNMSFNNAEKSLSSLEKRFSTLGIAGMTVIQNLTNSMINFAKKVSDYSIGGIIEGGKSRATKIENAKFQIRGLLRQYEDADKRLSDIMEDVNYGVESTAYGLDAAATVAAQLVASGMQAGEGMQHALRGISGVAAMTNSSYEEIGRIYTTVAGNGRLMGDQLLQLSSRGMNAAAVLADSLGTTESEVRQMVSKGQISFEKFSTAMDEAFGDHAKDANKTLNGVLSNIKAALAKIGADFFQPIIEQESPLINFLNSIRERINELRKALSPITKEVTDGINKVITTVDKLFKERNVLSFSPLKGILELAKKADGKIETIYEASGRFVDKIKEIEGAINKAVAPVENAAEAVNKVTDAIQDYQEIVDQIIYGSWGNGEDRFNALTEAGINYYKAQNMVNEQLGASFRYSDELVGSFDELKHEEKQVTKTTDSFDESEEDLLKTMQELTDEQLKQYGMTDDQVLAFRELDKMAKKTGLSMSYLLNILKNGDFSTRFLILNSFKNIGASIVSILKSIAKAFTEVFSVDASNLFDIVAAFHRITMNVREFIEKNSEGLTNTLKGIFSLIHMITSLLSGAFKFGLQIINTVLDAFGISILDVTGYIGNIIQKIDQWIHADNGLIAGIKVVVNWISKYIVSAIEWIKNNEKIREIVDNIKNAFHNIGDGFSAWIQGLKETDNIPKYIFDGLVNGIKENGPKVWEAIKSVAIGILDSIKKVLGIHSPSTEMYSVGENTMQGFINGVKSFGSKIGEVFSGIKEYIVNFFKGIDFGSLLATAIIGGTLFVTGKALSVVNNLINAVGKLVDSVAYTIRSVGNMLNGFGEGVKAWGKSKQYQAIANILKDLALLIAAIVASIVILGNLDPEKLKQGGIALGIIGAAIIGIMAALVFMSTKMKSIELPQTGQILAVLLGMATAIFIISMAIKKIANIDDPEKMLSATIAIVSIMIALGLVAVAISVAASKFNNGSEAQKLASVMLIVGASLLLVAKSLKTIAKLGDSAWTALGIMSIVILELVGVLVAIGVINKFTNDSLNKSAQTILAAGVCIYLLTVVIKKAAKLPRKGFVNTLKVIGVFSVLLVALMGISKMFGSTEMIKVSGSILLVAGAIALLALIVKMIGGIQPDQLAKGLAVITVLGLIVSGLIMVSRDSASLHGTTLMGVALVIGVMAAAVWLLGKIEIKNLVKGIVAVGALSKFMEMLLYAANRFKPGENAVKTLITMTVMIAVLAAIAVALSFIETSKILPAVAAVDSMVLSLAALIYSVGKMKINKRTIKTLITLTLIIAILAGVVAALSFIPNPQSAVAGALGVAILMGALGLVVLALDKLDGRKKIKWKVIGELAVLSVLMLGLAAILNTMGNTNNAIQNAIALSLLLLAMTGVVAIISKIGEVPLGSLVISMLAFVALTGLLAALAGILASMDNLKNAFNNALTLSMLIGVMTIILTALGGIGFLAIGLVAGVLAFTALTALLQAVVGVLSSMENLNKAITNSDVLTKLLTAMTECLFKIGIIGPLALIADVAIFGLISAITAIGALATAVGGLTTTFPNLEKFLNKGLPILEQIALSIGKILGNVVAGFINGVADELPHLGQKLSEFATYATPFFELMSTINGDTILNGIGAITLSILALCGAQLIDGITRFLSSGRSFVDLGKDLSEFGKNVIPFLQDMANIPTNAVDGVKNLAQAIEALTLSNLIDTIGKKLFGQEKDISQFGEQLTSLGEGIKGFSDALGENFDGKKVKAGAEAVKILAEAAEDLPTTGGIWSKIVGDQDISSFKDKFPNLGEGINGFSENLGKSFDGNKVKAGAEAVKSLAEAAKDLPTQGGEWQKLFGTQNMEEFSKNLPLLAVGIYGFALVLSKSNTNLDIVRTGTEMIQSIANLAKEGGFKDGKKMEEFAACFISFCNKLNEAIGSLNLINYEELPQQLDKITQIGNAVNNINSIDNSKIEEFGESFKKLSESGVNAFSDSMNGEDSKIKATESIHGFIDSARNSVTDEKKQSISDKFKEVSQSALDGLNNDGNRYQEFYNSGANFVQGFADGISRNTSIATAASSALARQTLTSLNNTLDEHSPSKLTNKSGRYFTIGFINGINEYANKAGDAAANIGNYATRGLQNAVSKVYDVIDSNIDNQPTIRPVLDLSDIESGTNILNSMLDMNSNLALNTNLNSISTSINRRLQNRGDNDVVSAIKDLSKSLSGNTGDTYNVNGINYSDDAEISDAIKTLVKASIVERRT